VKKTPDYFYGSLTLVTNAVYMTQICEGSCDAISPLRSADKDQDCVASFSVINQVLPCVAILCCV